MGYDRYAEEVINEKQTIYQRALKENWELFYTHDLKHCSSFIEYKDKRKYLPTQMKAEMNREVISGD